MRLVPPFVNLTFCKASACFISSDVSYPSSEVDEDITFVPLQCKEVQEMQLMYHWLSVVQMGNMQFRMDKQVILRKLCFTDSPINMWHSDRRQISSEIIYGLFVEMKAVCWRTKEESAYMEDSNRDKKQGSVEGICGLEGDSGQDQVCNGRNRLGGCLYM